jgi:hypothetical protein
MRVRKRAEMEAAEHLHAKAFRLITYRSADRKLEEQIWNSRDSAAPLVVYARDAETPLQHADSRIGQYAARQEPKIGNRIFVDITLDNVIAYKRRMVESEWENPEFQRIVVKSLAGKLGDNPSPLSIAQHLAECQFKRYRWPEPELIEVDEGVLEWLMGDRLKSCQNDFASR